MQPNSLILGSGPVGWMQIREVNKRCRVSMFMANVKGQRCKMKRTYNPVIPYGSRKNSTIIQLILGNNAKYLHEYTN